MPIAEIRKSPATVLRGPYANGREFSDRAMEEEAKSQHRYNEWFQCEAAQQFLAEWCCRLRSAFGCVKLEGTAYLDVVKSKR